METTVKRNAHQKLGQRRIAQPVFKDQTQHCIDAYLLDEVLAAIPQNVHILRLYATIGSTLHTRKAPVSNKLRRLGVTSMQVPRLVTSKRVTVLFEGASRNTIKNNCVKIAKEIGCTADEVWVDNCLLSYDNVNALFQRTTKELRPDDTDQRKKLKVLGLKHVNGDTKELLRVLSATSYKCDIQVVPVRTMICSKR